MEAASTVLHQSAWAADGTSCGQRDKERGKKKTELLRVRSLTRQIAGTRLLYNTFPRRSEHCSLFPQPRSQPGPLLYKLHTHTVQHLHSHMHTVTKS